MEGSDLSVPKFDSLHPCQPKDSLYFLPMPTYVIGHKNPDTDAICSALGYADFLRRTGHPKVEAACCGEVSRRTAFALERAGLAAPCLVMDVRPTVGQICSRVVTSASVNDSIFDSFSRMKARSLHSIPVLDEGQRVLGMLSLSKIIDLLLPDPENKSEARLVDTSLSRIRKGVSGEFQHAGRINEDTTLIVLVGASSDESFIKRLKHYDPTKTIVVTGDRESIQLDTLSHGTQALVITGGYRLNDKLLALAREKDITVITSPYDTATTTLHIKFARRITSAIDAEFLSFAESTPLEQAMTKLEHSNQALFPVLGEDQRLIGVFTKADLVDPPRTKLVLVDHNEFAQAVNGVEKAEILEVLDHHRLGGGLTTKQPIRFINEPVGSTCTIVSLMFRRANLEPSPSIALALASGLISDTLYLTSPTTTETDKEILAWLQSLAGCDLRQYADEFFAAGSLLQTCSPAEAVRADCKDYEENGWRFAAAQVEEQSLDDFWKHRVALADALEELRREKSLDFACLLITDITNHYSVLLVTGREEIISLMGYPVLDTNLLELKGIVSRKKQLLPRLMTVMGQAKRNP